MGPIPFDIQEDLTSAFWVLVDSSHSSQPHSADGHGGCQGTERRLAARRWHGTARARTLTGETLERLKLTEIRTEMVENLAHGQRQWVELGMVVAAEPEPEPTADLTYEWHMSALASVYHI